MKAMKLLVVLTVLAMLFTACAPAATPTAAVKTEAPAVAPVDEVPAVCASDAFGCAVFAPGEVVKLGMGAPMTGGDSAFGLDISQGAFLAAKDAGDFNGVTFEVVAEDDGGSPEGGAAVANKFAADPAVVAIPGHIFSGATAAAMPIYEKAGFPMLSPSATNPALTTKGSPVFNRIAFTDAIQGAFAANYLFEKLGVKKLALVHDGQDYGKGLVEVVAKEFAALGGEVVATEAITPKETDFTAVLSALASKAPEAVYFGGYTTEGAILANQMKQTGLENAVFFGCDGTYGADFLERTGPNGEGAFAVSLTPPNTEAKLVFDAAYEAAYGSKPGTLSPFSWNGYDVTAALISMVKSVAVVGGDGKVYVPRGALVAAVRGLKDHVGISGTFTCQENGECNASGPLFVVVKDGAWVPAP
ncbi:MAG: branched-chain amino acid transport system substrate-binding protein [Chloroflexi bacterium]|nr:MAG: branched-chain amino acid transport system substrate-binding protein [Chloroflexota bacterium]